MSNTTSSNPSNNTPFWRNITDEDVWSAISGSFLDTICRAYAKNYTPAAPLPLILMQGIVLMAVALTHREEKPALEDINSSIPSEESTLRDEFLFDLPEEPKDDFDLFPAHQSKVYIDTLNGNVPNAYVLVVAPSGAGKDMGNFRLVRKLGYTEYSGGTLEGIKDAAMTNPHLLINLSEFSTYFQARGRHEDFKKELTTLFDRGGFSDALSTHGTNPRAVDWVYPSVYASIQPEVLQTVGRGLDISQGLLSRFLIGYVSSQHARYDINPCNGDAVRDLRIISDGLMRIAEIRGVVEVPDPRYNTAFMAPIRPVIDSRMLPVLRRYANEYLPRIALMLALPAIGDDGAQDSKLPELTPELTSEHFERATVVMRRILTMAEEALGALTDLEGRARQHEGNLAKMLQLLDRMSTESEPITIAAISKRSSGTGWDAKTREALLEELQQRDYIKITRNGIERETLARGCVIELKKDNVPPGVL